MQIELCGAVLRSSVPRFRHSEHIGKLCFVHVWDDTNESDSVLSGNRSESARDNDYDLD